jgi:ATP-dependent Lhr-like helicase
VNEAIARIVSYRISKHIGESVKAVADPYRIMIKLPYPLADKYLLDAVKGIGDVRNELEESLKDSFMLKFRFTHVGRLFGFLAEDATVNHRLIDYMKNSVIYEEAMRSIFFRYFDVERTRKVFDELRSGKIKLVVDKRKELSYFGKLGIERLGGREAIGGFEPRDEMIKAFKERMLTKTVQLKCLNCGTNRFLFLATAEEKIKCAKCGSPSLYLFHEKHKKAKETMAYEAGLVQSFGKWGVYALASYGVGAKTADRVLAKLRKDEKDFWWDLIDAQKNFIKNKKYWKP